MPSTDTIRAAAHGRWRQIHAALGIPPAALTNKHQPCPCCGGRDRYRYDDHDGNGSFICTHYGNGGGDGFHLVMHYLDCDFKTALCAVAGVLGMGEGKYTAPPLKPSESPSVAPQDHIQTLARLWWQSRPIAAHDAVSDYLHRRGLGEHQPHDLHTHTGLPYWHDGAQAGTWPAMMGRITDQAGKLQGLHLTWLEDGHKLTAYPAKKMRSRYHGSLRGCAVRLYPATDRLAVCEGIETALAAHELWGVPVWACLSACGLKNLDLPPVQNLYIICDHDPAGMDAGRALADRATRAGITCRVWHDDEPGADALDVLNRGKHD